MKRKRRLRVVPHGLIAHGAPGTIARETIDLTRRICPEENSDQRKEAGQEQRSDDEHRRCLLRPLRRGIAARGGDKAADHEQDNERDAAPDIPAFYGGRKQLVKAHAEQLSDSHQRIEGGISDPLFVVGDRLPRHKEFRGKFLLRHLRLCS